MVTKTCTKCRTFKPTEAFSQDNRRGRRGLKSWCRTCCAAHVADNKGRHAAYSKDVRVRYKRQWTEFFVEIYGDDPTCEVCGVSVEWSSGHASRSVAFDHRHGEEPIQGSPAAFWQAHACTEANKAKWLACDFGVLCSRCNSCLPTADRGEWLLKALEYYGQTQKTNLAR